MFAARIAEKPGREVGEIADNLVRSQRCESLELLRTFPRVGEIIHGPVYNKLEDKGPEREVVTA